MTEKKKKITNEDLVREYQKETDLEKKRIIADELYSRVYKLILKMINLILFVVSNLLIHFINIRLAS